MNVIIVNGIPIIDEIQKWANATPDELKRLRRLTIELEDEIKELDDDRVFQTMSDEFISIAIPNKIDGDVYNISTQDLKRLLDDYFFKKEKTINNE